MPLHTGKGRTVSTAIVDIIDYVKNPEKTDHGKLITGWQCDSRTADAEFLLSKHQYIKKTGRVRGEDDVIAYHLRQSFRPGEITREEANRLGCELARRFTKGKTQHLFQEVDEYVRVDAEVTLPEKDAYSTYTLKMVDCDPDRLFSIFCPEGYGSYTLDDRRSLRYFESSGKKLVVRDTSISYSAYNIDLGENPMQDVNTLMYYFTQEHPQADPHDLSFMTVAEMENFCNDIFNQLGIVFEPKLQKCVTLTGQEIMDFQQELFGGSGNSAEMGFTPTNLTAATDTCYLEFSFTYDGLPLLGSEEPGVASAVSMMPTPSVTATIMINADGIQDFDMYFPCIIEAAAQPQTILTPDEAVAALKDKYDLEIHTNTEVFSAVWLEYIPIVTEDSVTLTPYWCFATLSTPEENPDGTSSGHPKYANAQRFNAITGKDLTYGG